MRASSSFQIVLFFQQATWATKGTATHAAHFIETIEFVGGHVDGHVSDVLHHQLAHFGAESNQERPHPERTLEKTQAAREYPS